MILFFDTSALVKLFHEERGSGKVTELVDKVDNEIWISQLSQIEFLSAVSRRYRAGEIEEKELDEAIKGFEEQVTAFHIEPLREAVVEEARSLLKQYGRKGKLRTLDALQLGTFGLISEKDWFFVAADDTLCEIVKGMGYNAINPLED